MAHLLAKGDPRACESLSPLAESRCPIYAKSPRIAQSPWHNPETKNACRIYTRMNADFTDASQWGEQHEWLRTNLETFYRVFSPIVKAFE
jgi:hypothetical protein